MKRLIKNPRTQNLVSIAGVLLIFVANYVL